jgi:hypothetical protein
MKPMHETATDPAEVYREQAVECCEKSAESVSPRAKSHWRKLARKWLSIAKDVDRRKRR